MWGADEVSASADARIATSLMHHFGVKEYLIMAMKLVRRSVLVVAASAGLLLASQPLANAAPASPVGGAPVGGGAIDSVLGIGTGAIKGVAPVLGLPTP